MEFWSFGVWYGVLELEFWEFWSVVWSFGVWSILLVVCCTTLENKNLARIDYVDLGPKTEDLILEAQINFPYQNFSNLPAERKRPISTLLCIRSLINKNVLEIIIKSIPSNSNQTNF